MTLTPGTRLGSYEIVCTLGAGGMGEVYRATDTKLKRQVAVKILPSSLAADPERLVRFRREAEVLAALNHPNIAAIYGLEESDGSTVRALIMELVEGETLAEMIDRSRNDRRGSALSGQGIPLDEALPIAGQIAGALEAAHERGIVHRDLKPANIKVRPDGTVKVLDFGLAKALDPVVAGLVSPGLSPLEGSSAAPGAAQATPSADSPTITSPAPFDIRSGRLEQGREPLTLRGVILGTAAYMSPEQARGRPVGRRADVWAFGAVLYEMVTGARAFPGDEMSDILARVIERDPDWSALPPATPSAITRLLRRCLEKRLDRRLRDMGDVRIEIDEAIANPQDGLVVSAVPVPVRAPWRTWVVAAVLSIAAGGLGWWVGRSPAADRRAVVRLTIAAPPKAKFQALANPVSVLSPDGSRLALVLGSGNDTLLHVRRLDSLEAAPIPGTEGALNPFFSPDGQWLAFTADRKLKKVRVDGSAPLVLCDASWGGGSWAPDDTIVFTPSYNSGLWRVPAGGGTPQRLTEPDASRHELGHFWPQVLPDGKHVLFTNFSTPIERSSIDVYSIDSGKTITLVQGGAYARYIATGHLLYLRAESVVAQPLDLRSLQVAGQPVSVVDDVFTNLSNAVAQISVADNGTMAYVPASLGTSTLVWVDRAGQPRPITDERGSYAEPRLSPDGRRLAVTVTKATRDVWVYDLERGGFSRVTSGAAAEFGARWRQDGRRLVMTLEQPVYQIFSKALSATAEELPIVAGAFDTIPNSVSSDDRWLVYEESHPATGRDLWVVGLDGGATPSPLLNSTFDERAGAVSVDGRWLAYSSDDTGRDEIYVQAFPRGDERWQISTGGGANARWSRDGRELFYWSGGQFVGVPIRAGQTFGAGKPVVLFENRPDRDFGTYDVGPDGQRFVMVQRDPDAPPVQVHVVLNWFEELRARMSK